MTTNSQGHPAIDRPTEPQIRRAIDELGGFAFQALADEFVRRWLPEEFAELVPYGRSSTATNNRWPDSYVEVNAPVDSDYVDPDGRIYLVESTNDAEARKVDEDLSKCLARIKEEFPSGSVSQVVHVAGRATLPRDRTRDWRTAFRAEGVGLRIITPTRLAMRLQDARFAPVWRRLGLRYRPTPFHVLRNSHMFHHTAPDVRPTLGELEETQGSASRTVRELERRLRADGCAIVRSHGAAGKTVLAAHIGLRHEHTGGVSYYLDLKRDVAGAVMRERTYDAIVDFADEGVLFIVDNVHLDEAFGYELVSAWLPLRAGSRLFVLGQQHRRPVMSSYGVPAPAEEAMGQTPVDLRVRSGDLRAIYRRLAKRRSEEFPQPPLRLPKTWRELQGDLVAFSVALDTRLESILAGGSFGIDRSAAVAQLRTRYLSELTDETSLVRVAAMSALELLTPEDVVDDSITSDANPHLPVEMFPLPGRAVYQLAHPRLGRLFLEAAERSWIDWPTLHDLVTAKPALAWPIKRRLDVSGVGSEPPARELIVTAWRRCSATEWHLPHHATYFIPAIDELLTLEIAGAPEVGAFLSAHFGAVLKSASEATSAETRRLLSLAREAFPALDYAFIGAFRTEKRDLLFAGLKNGSMRDLVEASRLLQLRKEMEGVDALFLTALNDADSAYWEDLLARTTAEDLHEVWTSGITPLREAVLAALANDQHSAALLRSLNAQGISVDTLVKLGSDVALANATVSKIGDLYPPVRTLEGAAQLLKELGPFGSRFVSSLTRAFKSHGHEFTPTAVEISHLAETPAGKEMLRNFLATPTLAASLGSALATARLEELQATFDEMDADITADLAAAIDVDVWSRVRLLDPATPANIRQIGYLLSEVGRSDLEKILAREVIRTARPADWVRPDAYAAVVRTALAADASPDETFRFLTEVATDSFVRRAYVEASSGVLATSFLAVWGHFDARLTELMGGVHLRNRAARAIEGISHESFVGAVSVIGAASLIGYVPHSGAEIDSKLAAKTIRGMVFEARPDRLRYRHIVFFLGLQTFGWPSPGAAAGVDASTLDALQALWEDAETPTPKLEQLRVTLAEWTTRLARGEETTNVRAS